MFHLKKYSIAFGFLIIGVQSFAQSPNDKATHTITADVADPLVIGLDASKLDFGDILPGAAKYIDAADGNATIRSTSNLGNTNSNGLTGGESRVVFKITGGTLTQYTYSLEVPRRLSDGNSNDMPIRFDKAQSSSTPNSNLNAYIVRYYGSTGNSISNNTDLSSDTNADEANENAATYSVSTNDATTTWTRGGSTLNRNVQEETFLVLGGMILPASDQQPGTYTGDITLTFEVSN
jgi:hypothetical protein